MYLQQEHQARPDLEIENVNKFCLLMREFGYHKSAVNVILKTLIERAGLKLDNYYKTEKKKVLLGKQKKVFSPAEAFKDIRVVLGDREDLQLPSISFKHVLALAQELKLEVKIDTSEPYNNRDHIHAPSQSKFKERLETYYPEYCPWLSGYSNHIVSSSSDDIIQKTQSNNVIQMPLEEQKPKRERINNTDSDSASVEYLIEDLTNDLNQVRDKLLSLKVEQMSAFYVADENKHAELLFSLKTLRSIITETIKRDIPS